MKITLFNDRPDRIGALRRFALTTTLLSIFGHLYLGFEQSYITPLASMAIAYALAVFFEWCRMLGSGEDPEYKRGIRALVDFLLPAHIIALTCAMFLYPGDRVWPIIFATALAMCSRALLRIPSLEGSRHFLNPSNFAILFTLVVFDSVSVFLPYQFHSNGNTFLDIVLPVSILLAGALVNLLFARRVPLVAAWLVTFVGQAILRGVLFDASILAGIAPATGTAAMLYTFFMITDPGTTPERPFPQILFGASIGVTYGILTILHIPYGLFWAVFIPCLIRGAAMQIEWIRLKSVHFREDISQQKQGKSKSAA